MWRGASLAMLVCVGGCFGNDGPFFDGGVADDGGFGDTGFGGGEGADCLRWTPDAVSFVDGVESASLELSSRCEFTVEVLAVTLDDPDGAFAIEVDGLPPLNLEPGATLSVTVSTTTTDFEVHEGQVLSQVPSFDEKVLVAAVAQLYAKRTQE